MTTSDGAQLAHDIVAADREDLPALRSRSDDWLRKHPEDQDVIGDAWEAWALTLTAPKR